MRMRTIGQAWTAGGNNFDMIRLIAALSVIVSHAFFVHTGDNALEPLRESTGYPLGWHAVQVFFVLSGFLVLASLERRESVAAFLAARAARIMPGLILVSLSAVLILGPLVTSLPLRQYFDPVAIVDFLGKTLFEFDTDTSLPGVFADTPSDVILGTVWTLKYEVLCYLGLAAAGLLGLHRRGWLLAVAALALLGLGAFFRTHPDALAFLGPAKHLLRLGGCFLLGMMAWRWRERIPLNFGILAALAALAMVAKQTPFYAPALYLAEAYAVMWLGFAVPAESAGLRLPADYSYGLYLFGFPVQQAIMHYLPESGPWTNMAIAIPATFALAAFSWHVVEKPFMRMKARAKPAAPALQPAE